MKDTLRSHFEGMQNDLAKYFASNEQEDPDVVRYFLQSLSTKIDLCYESLGIKIGMQMSQFVLHDPMQLMARGIDPGVKK